MQQQFTQPRTWFEINRPPCETHPNLVKQMLDHARPRFERREEYKTPYFDEQSETLAHIKKYAASWRALEVIYNYEERPGDPWANLWVSNMANAQAVRNRLLLEKAMLEFYLRKFWQRPIRALSIASGAAQGLLESVANLEKEGYTFELQLLDADEGAGPVAYQRRDALGVQSPVVFQQANAFKLSKYVHSPAHLVEMMGLLDYLDDKVAEKLLIRIREMMDPAGLLMVCHIHDNPEVEFMRKVIDWGNNPLMLYRDKLHVEKLLSAAGYEIERADTEPHGIHTVFACTPAG